MHFHHWEHGELFLPDPPCSSSPSTPPLPPGSIFTTRLSHPHIHTYSARGLLGAFVLQENRLLKTRLASRGSCTNQSCARCTVRELTELTAVGEEKKKVNHAKNATLQRE